MLFSLRLSVIWEPALAWYVTDPSLRIEPVRVIVSLGNSVRM